MEPTKAGILTSEFWVTMCVIVLGALPQVFQTNAYAQLAGLIAQGLAGAGYNVGRAMNKSADTKAAASVAVAETESK